MVQGLSMSSPLYTLLPRMYQELLATEVPGAAIKVHPQMLEACRETMVQTRGPLYELTTDDIRHMATRIERILSGSQWQVWTNEQYNHVKEQLLKCQDNAQRRLVMDCMAYTEDPTKTKSAITHMGPYLFVDDSRFSTSSYNTAIAVTNSSTRYAKQTGVIFETKQNSKSTLRSHPPTRSI